MPSAKKPYVIFLDQSVVDSIAEVAAANYLDDKKFAALCISKLSSLKPEYGLDALSAIPKNFFRQSQRTPSSRATGSDASSPAAA